MKQLDVEKLKKRLKQFLKEKFLTVKEPAEYTVQDVYLETSRLLRSEMEGLKNQPLNQAEEIKMEKLAKLLSANVLKEMKIL